MTVQTQTLAEFLLARLADAQEVVRQYRQVWDEDESSPFHPYLIEKEGPYLSIDPVFVLAECEAKRQIVEADARRWTIRKDAPNGLGYGSHPSGRISVRLGDSVELMSLDEFNERYCEPAKPSDHIRLLALPYAAHPDYREEWRL